MKSQKNIFLNHSRGSYAEAVIQQTIIHYQNQNIALIHQNLPEWTKIHRQFRKTNSTRLDFVGLFQGYYIEFEVKETSQTKFWLTNIQLEQWKRMANVNQHGGISFLIIYFDNQEQFFLILFAQLKNYQQQSYLTIADLTKVGQKLNLRSNLTLNLDTKLSAVIKQKRQN